MTGLRYIDVGLAWQTFNLGKGGFYRAAEGSFVRRLERILGEWEGTPYRNGQSLKGVGTFCTAFLCSVLDELYRKAQPTPLPDIPPDAAMHDPERARGGLRWFLETYPNHVRVEPEIDGPYKGRRIVQPGDVLVSGPVGGGPGHAILVGPRENTLWQCSGQSVHWTGLYLPDCYSLFAAYRMTDRETWLST